MSSCFSSILPQRWPDRLSRPASTRCVYLPPPEPPLSDLALALQFRHLLSIADSAGGSTRETGDWESSTSHTQTTCVSHQFDIDLPGDGQRLVEERHPSNPVRRLRILKDTAPPVSAHTQEVYATADSKNRAGGRNYCC